jgi:hypothetical protein
MPRQLWSGLGNREMHKVQLISVNGWKEEVAQYSVGLRACVDPFDKRPWWKRTWIIHSRGMQQQFRRYSIYWKAALVPWQPFKVVVITRICPWAESERRRDWCWCIFHMQFSNLGPSHGWWGPFITPLLSQIARGQVSEWAPKRLTIYQPWREYFEDKKHPPLGTQYTPLLELVTKVVILRLITICNCKTCMWRYPGTYCQILRNPCCKLRL